MEYIHKIELKNNKIFTIQRECDEMNNPRDWDNLGTMVCFHPRYILGDKHKYSQDEMPDILQETIFVPLYLYEHSGIIIKASFDNPFTCRFDSSQIGVIFVTEEKVKKEFNVKRITKKIIEQVQKQLIQEVITYNQFLNGDIYSFCLIEKKTCECCHVTQESIIDSCCGFYGDDFLNNGMLNDLDKDIKKQVVSYLKKVG